MKTALSFLTALTLAFSLFPRQVQGQSMAGMEARSRQTLPANEVDFIVGGACSSFEPNLPPGSAAICEELEKALEEDSLDKVERLAEPFSGTGLGHFWYGIAEVRQGDTTSGLKHLEAAVEIAAELSLARLNLGVAYYLARQTEPFKTQMQWVMTHHPENPWPYYYLGRFYSDELEDLRRGSELFQEALKRDPLDYRSTFHIGLNHELEGDLPEAEARYAASTAAADLKKAVFAFPLLGRARIQSRHQNLPEATRFAQQAVSLDPRLVDGRLILGNLYLQSGELEKAIAELKTAADLDPDHPTPHYMLARAYRKMERFSAAQQEEQIFSRLKAMREK